MFTCKGRGAQQEHQGQHQGGGFPLTVHGFLQHLRTGAVLVDYQDTPIMRLFTAMFLAEMRSGSALESLGSVCVQIAESSRYGTWHLCSSS
jgi:hypothetical protein